MSHRPKRLAAMLPLIVLVHGWACSDEPTHFGRPGGLSGKELPAPEGDGGMMVQPDSGGGPPPVDAGNCSISWSKDIFPNMAPTGTWQCGSSSCHGGITAPKVAADAPATYDNLAAYKMKASGLPYVLPGSTDPTKSGIECNLSGSCGTKMPITGGGAQQATQAQIATIDAWVKCGAPNN